MKEVGFEWVVDKGKRHKAKGDLTLRSSKKSMFFERVEMHGFGAVFLGILFRAFGALNGIVAILGRLGEPESCRKQSHRCSCSASDPCNDNSRTGR